MPVIILAGIGLFYLCSWIYNNVGKSTKPYNKEATDKIMIDCVGKSEKEKKKIIDDYQKRK